MCGQLSIRKLFVMSISIISLSCSAPLLAAPRFDHPLVLQVDVIHVGAGDVLMQANEQGVDRAVRF